MSSTNLSAHASTDRRVALCGSMTFYPLMLDLQDRLLREGVPSLVPEAEDHVRSAEPPTAFKHFKRQASFAYLKKIRDPKTFAVLIVNPDKHNIPGYIGPNTFAEIAVAFAQSKRVYLLYDIPEIYADELTAWNATSLRGSVAALVADFRAESGLPLRPLMPKLPLPP